jgi:prolipoprotein diacylglyceryltransferase
MWPSLGPIYLYDVCQGVGFLIAAGLMCRLCFIPAHFSKWKVVLILSGGFLVWLYGGALIPYLYDILNRNPAPTYLGSGRYFHSAFLTTLLYAVIVARSMRYPVHQLLDCFIIAAVAMSAVGRLGCFLNGCCKGKPTTLPWGVHFPNNPFVAVHPTQLYMFASELLLAVFLFRVRTRQRTDGQTFWLGVFLYSIYRIWIETLRTNPIWFWHLTHAQVFSIGTLILSAWMLARSMKRCPSAPR